MTGRAFAARVLGVLLAAAVALGTRHVAVRELPPDFDELAYIPAGYWYAERMVPGRWHELPDETENAEHPPLVKLAYAWQLRRAGAPRPDWAQVHPGRPLPDQARPAFQATRELSAAAGVAQVALLAAAAPVGGLWLALDTYHVKYTAEAYIEAIPGLLALLAIFLFERALRRREPQGLLGDRSAPGAVTLLASAVLLGLAAAGKYPYGVVVGLAMLPFLLWRTRAHPRLLGAFVITTALAFLAVDPALWPDPLGRLWSSVTFHFGYAVNDHVKNSGYPWWQPVAWLTTSAPSTWHKGLFVLPWLDRAILVAALLSAPAAWRRRPLWVWWALVGLVFLLAWPTKWPQYTLLVRTPLAGCAGLGAAALWDRLTGGQRRKPMRGVAL